MRYSVVDAEAPKEGGIFILLLEWDVLGKIKNFPQNYLLLILLLLNFAFCFPGWAVFSHGVISTLCRHFTCQIK